MSFTLKYYCLLLLLVLHAHAINYNVVYIDPTYMEMTLDDDSITGVDISIYDWDADLLQPSKVWRPLRNTSSSWLFEYSELTRQYGSVWLPASLRLHTTNTTVLLPNIITKMSAAVYSTDTTLPDSSPPDDGIPLRDGVVHRGIALWDANDAPDACMLQSTADNISYPYDEFHVAIAELEYGSGDHCGQCVAIRSSLHPDWLEALVIDMCPASFPSITYPNQCARLGWLDVSPAVFRDITDGHCGYYGNATDWGFMQMEYKYIPCGTYQSLVMKYQIGYGSNSELFRIQVRRHAVGLAGLDIRQSAGGDWVSLNRLDYNFYNGSGVQCPCDLRITSVDGDAVLDLSIIPAWSTAAGTVITGTVQLGVVSTSGGTSLMVSVFTLFILLLLL